MGAAPEPKTPGGLFPPKIRMWQPRSPVSKSSASSGDGVFEERTKVKLAHRGGPDPAPLLSLQEEAMRHRHGGTMT